MGCADSMMLRERYVGVGMWGSVSKAASTAFIGEDTITMSNPLCLGEIGQLSGVPEPQNSA